MVSSMLATKNNFAVSGQSIMNQTLRPIQT
jgi:hypothetical protein